MSTFAIDGNNDALLVVNAKGKKDLSLITDEVIAGSTKLFLRGQFFEGEWFLDTREGIPYFRLILVKNPDLSQIRRIFRAWLLSVDIVARVDRLVLNFDRPSRQLSMNFAVTAVDGRHITGGFGQPFIVTGPGANVATSTDNGAPIS